MQQTNAEQKFIWNWTPRDPVRESPDKADEKTA